MPVQISLPEDPWPGTPSPGIHKPKEEQGDHDHRADKSISSPIIAKIKSVCSSDKKLPLFLTEAISVLFKTLPQSLSGANGHNGIFPAASKHQNTPSGFDPG